MKIWKQARGDHILVVTLTMSVILSHIVGVYLFGQIRGLLFLLCTFPFSFFLSFWYLSTFHNEWINNELPKYHFWRDLLT
jgi:hypothetical protein